MHCIYGQAFIVVSSIMRISLRLFKGIKRIWYKGLYYVHYSMKLYIYCSWVSDKLTKSFCGVARKILYCALPVEG